MEILPCLLDQIYDEIGGTEEYATLALKYKDDDRLLADMYIDLSKQEYTHFQLLYAQFVKRFSSVGELPQNMQSIYDWQVNKITKDAAKAKAIQDMYK